MAEGVVMDNIIECPKHNGRFDYLTGEAKGTPVRINLRAYPAAGSNWSCCFVKAQR